MTRETYVKAMEAYGFPKAEAERMGDFALADFGSYEKAFEYFSHNDAFLRGQVYAGHRKARRLFREKVKAV